MLCLKCGLLDHVATGCHSLPSKSTKDISPPSEPTDDGWEVVRFPKKKNQTRKENKKSEPTGHRSSDKGLDQRTKYGMGQPHGVKRNIDSRVKPNNNKPSTFMGPSTKQGRIGGPSTQKHSMEPTVQLPYSMKIKEQSRQPG